MNKFKRIIHILNIPRHMATHLAGENHTDGHRRVAGVAVMVVGVTFVRISMLVDSMLLHIAADVIGYAIHGIGLIPFVSHIEKNKKDCVGDHCAV